MLHTLFMLCNICPRKCNINRELTPGYCNMKDKLVIRKVMLHQYEEPILTSATDKGSGAIFFAGCNLKCVYCQNYDVSHTSKGLEITPQELADIFKQLEEKGAGNIDLVTPTHFSKQIIEALKIYKPKVPVIWNTSGYENKETIKSLVGLVDIYLTDFKYANNDYSLKYSKAPNYVENITESLIEMKKQIPKNIFINGKMVRGIIVRHMVLPTLAKDSLKVLDIINDIIGNDAVVSIMSQYTPMNIEKQYEEINRPISNIEYKLVLSHANKLNMKNAFIQELTSSNKKYTPCFNNKIFEI